MGPAGNFALNFLHYHIGPFEVTSLTAPGLLMIALLLLAVLAVIVCFQEPHSMKSQLIPPSHQSIVPQEPSGVLSVSANQLPTVPRHVFLQLSVIVILSSQFILFFNQSTLETIVTPLSRKLYQWEEIQNSLMYIAIAAQFLVVYLVIHFLAQVVEDRWLILIGLILEGNNSFMYWKMCTCATECGECSVCR